jgi:Set1/Ash2 histone methyltransferase complex subunit ASH2
MEITFCSEQKNTELIKLCDTLDFVDRDVDGSKVHLAVREPYGDAYVEGDVIGFYISLPNGAELAPKYDLYVSKANRTVYPVPVDKTEGPPKHVPGIEFLNLWSFGLAVLSDLPQVWNKDWFCTEINLCRIRPCNF